MSIASFGFGVRTERASGDDTTERARGPSALMPLVAWRRLALDFLVELGDQRADMAAILRDDRGEFLPIGEHLADAFDAHIDNLITVALLGHRPLDSDGRLTGGLNDLRADDGDRVGLRALAGHLDALTVVLIEPRPIDLHHIGLERRGELLLLVRARRAPILPQDKARDPRHVEGVVDQLRELLRTRGVRLLLVLEELQDPRADIVHEGARIRRGDRAARRQGERHQDEGAEGCEEGARVHGKQSLSSKFAAALRTELGQRMVKNNTDFTDKETAPVSIRSLA